MVSDLHRLQKELQVLAACMSQYDTLILKPTGKAVKCQFLNGGICCNQMQVRDALLVKALKKVSVLGILEGGNYKTFAAGFAGFALHLKAHKLYLELMNVHQQIEHQLQVA